MYTETASKGWACDAPESTAHKADCSGTFSQSGEQCSCVTESTVYPIGTELMTVSFRHTFTIQKLAITGDSNLAEKSADGTMPIDTYFGANREVKKASGSSVTFTVGELLAMASPTRSLDTANTLEPKDARDGVDRYPMFRTTGALLTVDLEYSNKHPETGKPDISLSAVRAEATITAESGWAGLGALPTIYETIHDGNYTYSQLVRYRQGVVVNFRTRGAYYYFDFITMIMALVTASVLLGSATSITDLIAKNLYRVKRDPKTGSLKLQMSATSVVLRKKAKEVVNPEFVMATQSMNAVFAVASFRQLDKDNDGVVDAEDIVSAFAKVGGVGYEEAVEMAKLIMFRGDRGDSAADGKLTFTEFVSVIAQDTMPFSQLLDYMAERKRLNLSEHIPLNLNGLNAERYDDLREKEGFERAPAGAPAVGYNGTPGSVKV